MKVTDKNLEQKLRIVKDRVHKAAYLQFNNVVHFKKVIGDALLSFRHFSTDLLSHYEDYIDRHEREHKKLDQKIEALEKDVKNLKSALKVSRTPTRYR